jgi:hypothetical protein
MAPELGRVRRHQECHLYFARRMTFLSCADMPFLLINAAYTNISFVCIKSGPLIGRYYRCRVLRAAADPHSGVGGWF